MRGDTDKEWSDMVAGLIASDLIDAGVISSAQNERAKKIIAEKLFIRLVIGDRPEPAPPPENPN
jgi:hypothetical protein